MIVPCGGGGSWNDAMSVLMLPYAVPAYRNRRFGYVGAGTDENQRFASVNFDANE
jgi:hypothetical protein